MKNRVVLVAIAAGSLLLSSAPAARASWSKSDMVWTDQNIFGDGASINGSQLDSISSIPAALPYVRDQDDVDGFATQVYTWTGGGNPVGGTYIRFSITGYTFGAAAGDVRNLGYATSGIESVIASSFAFIGESYSTGPLRSTRTQTSNPVEVVLVRVRCTAATSVRHATLRVQDGEELGSATANAVARITFSEASTRPYDPPVSGAEN